MECLHPFYKVKYQLTASSIEITKDSACMGKIKLDYTIMINACLSGLSKESMDITNIIDVELVSKGCHGCCYSTIMVYDSKQVCPNKIVATKASHLSQLLVHAANV